MGSLEKFQTVLRLIDSYVFSFYPICSNVSHISHSIVSHNRLYLKYVYVSVDKRGFVLAHCIGHA